MAKEDKDSTEIGSLGGNSESESPPLSSGDGGGAAVGGLGVGITSVGVVVPHVVYTPVNLGLDKSEKVASGSDLVTVKRKRGRPRKYDTDGNLLAVQSSITSPLPSSGEFSSFTTKRGRGRPRGSGDRQILASLGEIFANSQGRNLTPHAMTVERGEDVSEKILSIAEKGPVGITILSANGTISNVTIRRPGSSRGLVKYEGPLEIITLKGSFAISENGRVRSKVGGLMVSLAGPDGGVVGGEVLGLLLAVTPIQIILGTFVMNGKPRMLHVEPRIALRPG